MKIFMLTKLTLSFLSRLIMQKEAFLPVSKKPLSYLGKIYIPNYLLRAACTWSLGTISSLNV